MYTSEGRAYMMVEGRNQYDPTMRDVVWVPRFDKVPGPNFNPGGSDRPPPVGATVVGSAYDSLGNLPEDQQ